MKVTVAVKKLVDEIKNVCDACKLTELISGGVGWPEGWLVLAALNAARSQYTLNEGDIIVCPKCVEAARTRLLAQ